MVRLYIRVKFRAFRITWQTIEREIDVTAIMLYILRGLKGINPAVTRIIEAYSTWGITGEYIQLDKPYVIHPEERGIYIELR